MIVEVGSVWHDDQNPVVIVDKVENDIVYYHAEHRKVVSMSCHKDWVEWNWTKCE